MTDNELRKLTRSELLELLIDLTEENEELRKQNGTLHQELQNRMLTIQKAGSLAEAAIQINNVFAHAQNAADQYLENIRRLDDEARKKADEMLRSTEERCTAMEAAAKMRSEALLSASAEKCEAEGNPQSGGQTGNSYAERLLQMKENLETLRVF